MSAQLIVFFVRFLFGRRMNKLVQVKTLYWLRQLLCHSLLCDSLNCQLIFIANIVSKMLPNPSHCLVCVDKRRVDWRLRAPGYRTVAREAERCRMTRREAGRHGCLEIGTRVTRGHRESEGASGGWLTGHNSCLNEDVGYRPGNASVSWYAISLSRQ